MDFRESETYHNLQAAYRGELMASAKYDLYGHKAQDDGFEQIGNIFEETSRNEREHAEIWLKQLHGGEVPSTLENLRDAAEGENHEWMSMYPEYADTAMREGYPKIAELFQGVARVENNHDGRFETLAWNIESNQVFCREHEAVWICLNCGHLVWGNCAPDPCPLCGYPQGYYQLYCEAF